MRQIIGWLRLVRVPNLATAVADVLAGFLVASGLREVDWLPPAAGWAIAASICLYAAGMVLNDVFDLDVDRRERPERPLPSGQVALATAAFGGHVLLVAGAVAAAVAGVVASSSRPAVVGLALAAAVWAYDRGLKRSWLLGPAVMGLCRGLNWLLGMTAAGMAGGRVWLVPLGMGLYVAGVTLFARYEADDQTAAADGTAAPAGRAATRSADRLGSLGVGAAVMVAGLATAAGPVWRRAAAGLPLRGTPLPPEPWLVLWSIIAASVLVRAVPAIVAPSPARIQAAVGNAIMSIITLDAVLVLAFCGESWALVVLMLLAWFVVGRRIVPPT